MGLFVPDGRGWVPGAELVRIFTRRMARVRGYKPHLDSPREAAHDAAQWLAQKENGVFQFQRPRALTMIAATGLVAVGLLAGCAKKGDDEAPKRPSASSPTITQGGGGASQGSASIAGKITFMGDAPAGSELSMNADPVCDSAHTGPVVSEDVVVSADGGLQNVIVYVKTGASGNFSAPSTAVVLDQKGCVYVPHVVALQVGQTLELVNSDTTTHNVHALSDINKTFNKSMPIPGMRLEESFDDAEIFKVKCDVHPWMASFVGVFDNPFFAVTAADGSFKISGLPAGTYTIAAMHEIYGEKTATVTVGDGEAGAAAFSYGG